MRGRKIRKISQIAALLFRHQFEIFFTLQLVPGSKAVAQTGSHLSMKQVHSRVASGLWPVTQMS